MLILMNAHPLEMEEVDGAAQGPQRACSGLRQELLNCLRESDCVRKVSDARLTIYSYHCAHSRWVYPPVVWPVSQRVLERWQSRPELRLQILAGCVF